SWRCEIVSRVIASVPGHIVGRGAPGKVRRVPNLGVVQGNRGRCSSHGEETMNTAFTERAGGLPSAIASALQFISTRSFIPRTIRSSLVAAAGGMLVAI